MNRTSMLFADLFTARNLRSLMAVAMASVLLGSAGCVNETGDLGQPGDDDLGEVEGDDVSEGEDDDIGEVENAIVNYGDAELRIVTFNVHGADQAKLETFKGMLTDNDRIIVLQEVGDVGQMRNALAAEFPYEYITENYADDKFDWSCLCTKSLKNRVVVRSKLPIVQQESNLIQTDPGGDHWRRHAQYVRIKLRDDVNIRLFHYHNTYNWHNDSSASEKAGMQKFKTWVESKVGALSAKPERVIMAGDFNLEKDPLDDILGSTLNYQSSWVDHVVTTNISLDSGGYKDSSAISDHNMVWSQWNTNSNITTAQDNVVRLWEHGSYTGLLTAFERGNTANIGTARGTFWNDRVSSMTAGSKVKLHAWEHQNYGGTKWCLPAEAGCGSSGFNDKITSLKVMSR